MALRSVGVLEMVDQGKKDEKVLGVGIANPIYKDVSDYHELYPHVLRGIEHFFSIYKELEGKQTQIVGWRDASRARAIVEESHQRYIEKESKTD